jgi:hypothetical protein
LNIAKKRKTRDYGKKTLDDYITLPEGTHIEMVAEIESEEYYVNMMR